MQTERIRPGDLTRFLAERVLSSLGEQMLFLAVGWQVYSLTHRALDLGLVGLAQFLPAIGLSLFAGHVADRFDRRKIVMVTEVIGFVCALLLFIFTERGDIHLWHIFTILVVLGAAHSFHSAATNALLPHLVSAQRLPRAIAWNSSLWQATVIIGPAAGGFLYGWRGEAGVVYGAAAILSALSVILLAGIRVRAHSGEKGPVTVSALLAGIDYIMKHREVLGAISMDLFAVLLGGAVALLPIYASDILKVGPFGLGILRSAPGVGALLMGLFISWRPIEHNAGKKMYIGVAIFGLATVAFGLSTSFSLSLVCLVVMGASDLVSVVIRAMLIQVMTPQNMRGRVGAVNSVFIGASNELGQFESGVTAALWGAVPAVVVGGIGTCAIVVIWIFLFPQLLKLDKIRPSDNP